MKWLLLFLLFMPDLSFGEIHSKFAEQCVRHYADRYRVPAELIAALIDVESHWNPRAVSTKGAMGLMQLMPDSARRFGALHPFDIEENIAAGTRYVTILMWKFHGDLRLVTAAYYAGDYPISKRQLNYRNPDVVAYVEAVRQRYRIRKAFKEERGQ
jgi:soluble lytic murein transglycosylase-like protein